MNVRVLLQGKLLSSAAGSLLNLLSPLALQALGAMAGTAKTTTQKMVDCLKGQTSTADVQKRSASAFLIHLSWRHVIAN